MKRSKPLKHQLSQAQDPSVTRAPALPSAGEPWPPYIHASPDGVTITVQVQPNAFRTGYAGIHGDALKFYVAAPPADGAANEALCRFLADRFGLPKSSVKIRSGTSARRKRVLLKGLAVWTVMEVLELSSARGTVHEA